jgi:hypothetical protein
MIVSLEPVLEPVDRSSGFRCQVPYYTPFFVSPRSFFPLFVVQSIVLVNVCETVSSLSTARLFLNASKSCTVQSSVAMKAFLVVTASVVCCRAISRATVGTWPFSATNVAEAFSASAASTGESKPCL